MENYKHILYKDINEDIYEKTLENGLKVIIIKKPDYKKYFACLSCKFGGLVEKYKDLDNNLTKFLPFGTAHFLEHKKFDFDDKRDISFEFSMLGGNSNAFTDYNMTTYLFDAYKNFDELLILLLDFVQKPYFTDKSVKKEKGIIIQEYKSYHDSPWEKLRSKMYNNLYDDVYTNDILGDIKSIKAITKEDLYQAFADFYVPSNMILSLAGDIDVDKTFKLIEDNQNKKTFTNKHMEVLHEIENKKVRKKSIIKLDIPEDLALVGFRIDKNDFKHNDRILFSFKLQIILEKLLGKFSDNYQAMLDKNLISSLGISYGDTTNNHHFLISATLKDEIGFVKYIKKIFSNLDKINLSDEEFEVLKRGLIGPNLFELNDLDNCAINYADFYFKDCNLYEVIEELMNLQKEEVLDVIKYINIDNMTIVIGKGKGSSN